jgi:hypothetical protein
VPRPVLVGAETVIAAPGDGPGHWAGAPSCVRDGDGVVLAYRLRRPVGDGRGYANVVARSDDGVHFETVCVLERDAFAADSLERPALVRRPDGGWRIYVSSATPGTLHWRVDALDADDPSGFEPRTRVPVFPGDAVTAVKDVVVQVVDGRWHAWPCVHDIADTRAADRMHSAYCTSDDGLSWRWHGVALRGRPGHWDERGARRRRGVAGRRRRGRVLRRARHGGAELGRDHRAGDRRAGRAGAVRGRTCVGVARRRALRYVCSVALADGGTRFYYEVTRTGGAHDLRTEYSPAPCRRASRCSRRPVMAESRRTSSRK